MARNHPYTLQVGTLVGTSISVYLRNLIPFTFLGVVVQSPWIAVEVWNHLNPPASDAEMAERLPVGMAILVLQMVLGNVLAGAVTYGVVQQLRGTPAGIAASISNGLSCFFRVLGTGVLYGIRVFLFSLLLLIPGIIEMFRLFVAIPVAVMEGQGAGHSIERSKELTLGSRGQLFGAWILIVVISAGLGGIVGFVSAAAGHGSDDVQLWVTLGLNVVLGGFGATIAAVAYFMLRKGKENVDAKAIAAVFD